MKRLARQLTRSNLKHNYSTAIQNNTTGGLNKQTRVTPFDEKLVNQMEKEGITLLQAPGGPDICQYIQQCIPKFVQSVIEDKGHVYIQTNPKYVSHVHQFLYFHLNTQVKVLSDIAVVDYLRGQRFQVNWNLKSYPYLRQFFVKTWLGQNEEVVSVKNLYPSALWYEREAYDMFGVMFAGERETRRMLNDYGFRGHPLRKDFPLTGFTEVYYDFRMQNVSYKPSTLIQEYRFFHKPSVWNQENTPQINDKSIVDFDNVKMKDVSEII